MRIVQALDKGSRVTSLRVVLSTFLISRFCLGLTLLLAARFVPLHASPWTSGIPWIDPLVRWDAGWYLDIVQRGYRFVSDSSVQCNVAFFPLYPLLVWGVGRGLPFPVGGVMLSNLSFLVALLLLHRLLERDFDRQIADWGVLFLAFFPTTIFCSAMYTESLFLALTIGAFLALRSERWMLFGVLGGLASGTRITGVLLGLPGLFEYVRNKRHSMILALGLLPAGLFGFMAFLCYRFGNPFAFLRAMKAPGWERSLGIPLGEILLGPIQSLQKLVFGGFSAACFDVWFLYLFLALAVVLWRKAPRSYFVYTAGGIIMLLASSSLLSIGRYLMVLFPAYAAMALVTKNRPVLRCFFLGGSVILSTLFAILYSRWYWAG